LVVMAEWSFLTNHARVLVCIVHDPGVRLRDIATMVGVTERSAYGIVTELAAAGYVVKERDGRRNRYHVQAHLPLREVIGRQRTIGEMLELLVDANAEAVRTTPPG
jgi:Mn-dependent DtxR family transcriptional regulator